MLPDTINNTPAPGTPVDSQTNMDLQKWMAEIWAIQRHASYSFVEDFDGPDLSQWLSGGTSFVNHHFASSGSAANWVGGFDDTAKNSVGAVRFNHAATNANTMVSPGGIALSQSDLYLTARLRVPQMGGTNSSVFFGLYDFAGTSSQLLLMFNPTLNGNSNWWLQYGLTASVLKSDTGVARGTTNQQIIDIARTAGVITVAFDGAAPALSISPTPFSLTLCQHAINASAQTSGTTEAIVDYYKLWARTAR
jgi:hypothetical protein